jgi:Asp-tRNA(Asn)/Glu-tRNA(Gln) amidotransferase A subunit family amidase
MGFQLAGKMLDEASMFAAGHAFQGATNWHARHPMLS